MVLFSACSSDDSDTAPSAWDTTAVAVIPWGLIIAAIVVPVVYIVKKYKKKSGKDKLLGG